MADHTDHTCAFGKFRHRSGWAQEGHSSREMLDMLTSVEQSWGVFLEVRV